MVVGGLGAGEGEVDGNRIYVSNVKTLLRGESLLCAT